MLGELPIQQVSVAELDALVRNPGATPFMMPPLYQKPEILSQRQIGAE